MQQETASNASGGSQTAPLTHRVAQALQAAVEHHQASRFAAAESIYRQVLQVEPLNFDALHMLGVLAHQVGQHAQAVELISQAIRQDRSDPLAHNNLGNAYRALGRHEDALASFKEALFLKPDFFQVQNNIGETYRVLGRYADALTSFTQALSHDPNYAEAHNNMGLVLLSSGKFDDAAGCFNQALALKPDYAKARNNLGNVYRAMGKIDEAMACYDKALSLNPDLPEALYSMGSLLKNQGNLKAALLCCQRALLVQPAAEANWRLYAELLKLLSTEAIGLIHVSTLLQAFKQENIDPQNLERISVALICADTANARWMSIADDAIDGARQIEAALAAGDLDNFMSMPLLLAVLEDTIVTHYSLEKLLILVRRALLATEMKAPDSAGKQMYRQFIACLAQQCFFNEYIYVVSDEELNWIGTLQDHVVATKDSRGHFPIHSLMLLGAYQPLSHLDFAKSIRSIDWPEQPIKNFLRRQLIDPLEEKQIRTELPSLTNIGNETSQAVRQQYEENPYPRWRRRGKVGQGLSVHASLKQRFPHKIFSGQFADNPEILIAGCGTGSDAVQIVQSFRNANILAVDISLSSLAYAKRATTEMGIDNIDFRHADILELGTLERTFDVIVSSGVLHHMRDPMAGWSNLVGLLRPGGFMNIGLYSRRARHEVTRVRRLIQEIGYQSTLEGIRRFRSEVMSGTTGVDIGRLSVSPDFYSTSACRDLLFHVEEHLFSPLEIRTDLKQLDLEFLGFEFSNPQAISIYLARFPNNPACDSLENWEVVEQENPTVFSGMYQFWVKKEI